MIKVFIVIALVFASTPSFSEELDLNKINTDFAPVLCAMSDGDYGAFKNWFVEHSFALDGLSDQISNYTDRVVKPKLPLYGKVISTRIVRNVIIGERYGCIMFLQRYENLFMLWKFYYFLKDDGSLVLKKFSVDDDADTDDLFSGKLATDGLPLDIKRLKF